MNWFARRKTLKLVAIFALLLCAGIAFLLLRPDELARYKARLAADGEELSLLKLSPPYSKEAANFHDDLNALAARFAMSPIHPAVINLMSKPTGGVARLAWTRPTPIDPTNGTWADLARQVDNSEPALAEFRHLLTSLPRGSAHDVNAFNAKSKVDFISQRKAAQFLAAAVVNELHRERLDAALTNLHTLIAMARLHDEGGMLVDYMIHIAIAGLAVSATWESLHAPGWTDSQLGALQSAWQPLNLIQGWVRVVEMERAYAVAYYALFRTNATQRRQMFGMSGGGNQPFTENLYENLYLPMWAKTWSKGDELKFLEAMQPIIHGVRHAATNGNYHAVRATFAEAMRDIRSRQTLLNKLRFPLASMVVPNWEKAATTLLRHETQRQMALTAIALKRYELKHGKLPTDLAALKPELLPAPPTDHLNGRPLTYQRLSDHRFTLRSVGNNERDDQGVDDDIIWPEPDWSGDSSPSIDQ